ncbi:MAG: phosphotransferase family protein [Actinomycetes bacterium]
MAEGIDVEAVTDWLTDRTEVAPPLAFDVIAGGRSNLTYRVRDAEGRRFVLRRPPLHSVLESAHDVAREHRIMAALAGSDVPVPEQVGVETDPAVTGAPFYVMRHVDGLVVRTPEDAARDLDPAARVRAGQDLVDTLVRLHAVDPDEVGLGDLARRDGYIERQLKRWKGQLEKGSTRELPLLHEVHARLAADVPAQGPASIVHGDYRLDNLMVSPRGDVLAVLDWELCTLGDPLADVGLLQVYWTEPGEDELNPLGASPTSVDGFPTRAELTERYAQASGRDLSQLDFYVAFGFWKLAIILEGVYQRFTAGAYEHVDEGVQRFGDTVHALAERAHEAAGRAGR